MVMMDAYYSHDRLLELWGTIDRLHLSYLQMDDGPSKLDQRSKLEDCIKDFLCVANHNQKFCFPQTADVLHRSASNKKDFSGYKAATGWNAIQLYASNLVSQPWRKEYRQIKTYCGFYKHQIEANLVGAEIMFEAMGYKHFGDGILMLDGPICPDLVTNVSKDCLIAHMECQILKAIWEGISSSFPKTWLDILEFRKSHICSPEQAIRAINYQNHQKQYQQDQTFTDIYNSNKLNQNMLLPPLQQQVHNVSSNSTTLPIMNYNHLASQSFLYPNNGCCNYVQVPPNYCTMLPTNGYCCTNGFGPQNYYSAVPTAQLIELDHNVDVTDRGVKVDDLKNRNQEDLEDWDYVYRNLKSQGYSKDLGERGDLLRNAKKKPTNLDEAVGDLTVTERPLKISEALEKYDKQRNPESSERTILDSHSRNSSYENISSKATTKTLPRHSDKINADLVAKSKTLDLKRMKCKKETTVERWQCKFCTYLNENANDICEVCSKSKVVIEQQMEIGGPQCSKCTLVNPKDVKNCRACAASLKNSPTYI